MTEVKSRTVLDALGDLLGSEPREDELESLSLRELTQLGDELGQFWVEQAAQAVPDDTSLIGGWRSAFASEPLFRSELSDSLLYYPRLLLTDPLADFFSDRRSLPSPHKIRYRRGDGQFNILQSGPEIWARWGSFESFGQDRHAAATRFARIVANLRTLEPLMTADVLHVRSQWPVIAQRQRQLETAVRFDVDNRGLQEFIDAIPADEVGVTAWDNLQGMSISADGQLHPPDAKWRAEPFFYYLNKMLALADAFDAQFVPPTARDLGLLRLKVGSTVAKQHPSAVLRAISRIAVPTFEVPIREAVAIRRSSSDFEDWRLTIRSIQRTASAASDAELGEIVEEQLRPRISALIADTKARGIRGMAKTDGAELVIDAMIGAGVALATQQPLLGVATGTASGAARWVWRAYTRNGHRGADAVLATLLRKV